MIREEKREKDLSCTQEHHWLEVGCFSYFIDLLTLHVELSCEKKIVTAFLESCTSCVLRALQVSPGVACYARTHIMMLHTEFCTVWLSLSNVRGKIILLISKSSPPP